MKIEYKKRIWYPGACYHVMSRGVRGGMIVKGESDYEIFLQILKECQKRYEFKVHSYCLMANHFHLQMETREEKLSTIMERLLKAYAITFNRKYKYCGHVFQGRYKGILIEDSRYFLETGRYIHLNPVKARMVHNAEDYPYSNFKYYISAENNDIPTKDKVLSYFRDYDPMEYAKHIEAKRYHEQYVDIIVILV